MTEEIYESVGIALALCGFLGFAFYFAVWAVVPELSSTFAVFWSVFTAGLILFAYGKEQ